jgi:PrtD family type I secretion system ABC transporter
MAEAKRILRRVGGFSLAINLLVLTSPLYMMQVYDRVLTARSEPTLLYLTLFALACLAILGALELVRSRILVRMGEQFDAVLADRVFTIVLSQGRSGQSFRDLDALRTFLTGAGMLALLDAPWTPIYLFLVYLLHPMLGHVALFGVLALLALGLLNERLTRKPLAEAGAEMATSTRFAELSARNAEAVRAMGMLPGLQAIWRGSHTRGLALQSQASDRAGDIAAAAKFVRFFLQVAILGMGAYLVILQECTGGVMIAASIIMGRGLAPVETSIGAWRGFLMARLAYRRLKEEFADLQQDKEPMALPAPTGAVLVEKLVGGPPGVAKPVIAGASFTLNAGSCLGIAGPSAAGKSTLARLLVGVWRPLSGEVRLDHVNIADWRREEVGPHIGYLPQDIELFPASVAVNIARFGKIDAEKVVEAAKLAGAHEMILELPDGYDTVIGIGGNELSGGQRQKIALARAFYGFPALIVLDEPTSNLDSEGEAAVSRAIEELKQKRRTVVVIAHRLNLLITTDALMVLQKGVITQFGKTSEIMPQITRPVAVQPETSLSAKFAG